ncbi:MAG: glycosyltransferase [Planctomycetes bacterium]|jgi:glycosyltransferase involved in cell wall biosynthesis|nr:glycosyltransferase [Planctomycetota bacterium]
MPPAALIIPARNEAPNIPGLFDALRDLPPGTVDPIVLCDNGSTDDTAALARPRGATIVRESRPGYGGACLAGLRHLASQPRPPAAVAFLDADLADDPAELPRLLAPIHRGEADLVIGSRHRLAEPGALDPHQRFGNRLACGLLRLSTGRRYTDLGPMRALSWEALQRLDMRDMTWGWTVEMQFKAAKRGLRVIEIDVPYRKRHAGASKISGSLVGSWKAGTKIIGTIARLWWSERKTRAAG